jgi:hypothetical protein
MTAKPMFEVDRHGLAQILARRGVEFAVLELIQNALDESGVTRVAVQVRPSDVRGHQIIAVTDDAPAGFGNLSHAYTLFAPSQKKANPEQRGRFNLGEKLVIACSRSARVTTTTGSVIFRGSERTSSRDRTEVGSIVEVEIKMCQAEVDATLAAIRSVLCPPTIELSCNGTALAARQALRSKTISLPTERADSDGYLRATTRATTLSVYAPVGDEVPTLYEMGIPVVALDCAWHVDIAQKIPLNMDRDNVTPAYRRAVLTAVVNLMHEELAKDDASAPWVGEALASADLLPEAVDSVLTARYGAKRVIADPSDPEGTKLAVSKGYNVIQAGSFNRAQWATIRSSGTVLPAGQVTPSPKPWSNDPDAPTAKRIERADWTAGMAAVAAYVEAVGARLVRPGIRVEFYSTTNPFAAAFGGLIFQFNAKHLGRGYFERALVSDFDFDDLNRLVIHELGHYYSLDHLSERYHDALCKLGAKLARIALDEPGFFAEHRATKAMG